MAETVNEKLFDFQVAQSIRWIKLGNREAKEAVKILESVNEKLSNIIRDGSFSSMRREALKVQVENLLDVMHDRIEESLTSTTQEVAVLSSQIEVDLIKQSLPIALDIVTPNLGVLQNAATLEPFNGAVLGDWIEELRKNDKARTWRTILDGIISGETTDNIVRSVIGSPSLRYKDGVREVTKRGIRTLVRTSINHATNVGRDQVWSSNQDLVKYVKWVSTLDTRTTPICRVRDGRVGPTSPDPDFRPPKGSKVLKPQMARPPAHPNCRSTTVAVTKSWKELGFDFDELDTGSRSSLDGRVPDDLTYFDWLTQTSKKNQIEALGETRYKLWKEGGLKVDKFQNDEGMLYTLEQLKAKHKEAFSSIGLA